MHHGWVASPDAAGLGDGAAGVILETVRRASGGGDGFIANVFGPDVIIPSGGVTIAWRTPDRTRSGAPEALASRTQGQRAFVVEDGLGNDRGLIGTVLLVASALSGLVTEDDHQNASADPAGATT